jgi:cellulose synthase/poly-beta-1,6-N-acetylglucosamine synthase-like glycosyltransferase
MLPDMLPELLVGTAAAAFGYHHFAYPALLKLCANRVRRTAAQAAAPSSASSPAALPSVTIIVPAHNEQAVIEAKIANIAALDYPHDLLHVVIACDGCTDNTVTLARRAVAALDCAARVEIVEFRVNIGKVAVLNDCIAAVTSDIVALSDTSAVLEPDAIIRAVAHFAAADVGVVCPTYRLLSAGSEGERAYWDYQTRIKADEALVGAPMGAHGAFYLFRRNLWTALPADTINDDFIMPMNIIASGNRAVYDATIVATELETTHPDQEFRRRVRIGAGNLQQVLRLPALANPLHPGRAFVFLSGKGIRPLIPFLAIAAGLAAASRAADGDIAFQALLAAGLLVLAAAAYAVRHRQSRLPRIAVWLGYLVEGYAASLIGASRYIAGLEGKPWTRAQNGTKNGTETGTETGTATTKTLTEEFTNHVNARS